MILIAVIVIVVILSILPVDPRASCAACVMGRQIEAACNCIRVLVGDSDDAHLRERLVLAEEVTSPRHVALTALRAVNATCRSYL